MEEERQETEDRNFFEQPNTSRPVSPSGQNRSALVAIVLIVILALGLGGWFVFKGRGATSPTPTPSPTIEISTPSPTVAPTSDRSSAKIEILNGTGISGEAALLKDKLSALGYSDFKLGNSASSDNRKTQVSFSSDVALELRDEIEGKLGEIYQSVEAGRASPTGDVDVQIVTGLRKGVTPKPSPTATSKATSLPTATPKATSSPTPTSSPTASPTATP